MKLVYFDNMIQPLICHELNFLFEEKIVSHSQDIQIFKFFMNPENFKVYDVIIDITAYQKIRFQLSFLNAIEYQDETW